MSEKKSVYEGKVATLQGLIEPGDDAAFIFEQLLKLELPGSVEDCYVEAMMLERGLSYDLLVNEAHMEVMRRMFLVRLSAEEVAVLTEKKREVALRKQSSEDVPAVVQNRQYYVEWLATKDVNEVVVVAGDRDSSVASAKGYGISELVWFELEGVMGMRFLTAHERDRYVKETRDIVVVIDKYAVKAISDVRSNVIDNWDEVMSVDCEMVGSQNCNRLSAIVIVDKDGEEQYRAIVKPHDHVDDYRERYSTITRDQVQNGRDEEEVVREVREILKGKVVVMHDCRGDLSVLPGLNLRGVIDTYTLTGSVS